MSTLYFDLRSGVAGDMMAAALLDLHPKPKAVLQRLNQLGIPEVSVSASRVSRRGIRGLHLSVTWRGEEEGAVHRINTNLQDTDPSTRSKKRKRMYMEGKWMTFTFTDWAR